MSKKDLIKRLKWYYPMEMIHAFITFPIMVVWLLFNKPLQDIVFILYGLALCIFILYQGQHYWKLKLYTLTGRSFDRTKNLTFFRKSKKINLVMIALVPLVLMLQLYLNDWSYNGNLIWWAVLANVFGILEHINYYHRQLMVDNTSDINYLIRNRKLKTASLAKDLLENEI